MVPAALTPIPEDDIAKVAQSMSSWTSHTMSFPLKIPDDSLEDSGDEQQSSSDNGTVVLSNGMCFSGGYGDVWLGRLEDGLKRRSASVLLSQRHTLADFLQIVSSSRENRSSAS